jgi:hypothetical protein
MSKIFMNPNQIREWVEAAAGIQDHFGTDKALGHVIGKKFYNLVKILHTSRTTIRDIENERKKPDYNPIRERTLGDYKFTENLDETYLHEKEIVTEAEGLLPDFASLIKTAFPPDEIQKYFESHPRLGIHGHISTEEDHEFLVKHGAIEYSIDTETEDALIFGDMMKYFGLS